MWAVCLSTKQGFLVWCKVCVCVWGEFGPLHYPTQSHPPTHSQMSHEGLRPLLFSLCPINKTLFVQFHVLLCGKTENAKWMEKGPVLVWVRLGVERKNSGVERKTSVDKIGDTGSMHIWKCKCKWTVVLRAGARKLQSDKSRSQWAETDSDLQWEQNSNENSNITIET